MQESKRQHIDPEQPITEISAVLLLEHRFRHESSIYVIPASEMTPVYHLLFEWWSKLDMVDWRKRNADDNRRLPLELKVADADLSQILFDGPGDDVRQGLWDKYKLSPLDRSIQIDGKSKVYRFSLYRY